MLSKIVYLNLNLGYEEDNFFFKTLNGIMLQGK